MENITVFQGIIIALIGAFGGIITSLGAYRLNKASSTGILTDSALKLVQVERTRYEEAMTEMGVLMGKIDDLEKRVELLEHEKKQVLSELTDATKENAEFRLGIDILLNQLDDLKKEFEADRDDCNKLFSPRYRPPNGTAKKRAK